MCMGVLCECMSVHHMCALPSNARSGGHNLLDLDLDYR